MYYPNLQNDNTVANCKIPANEVDVVFGVYLSAQAVYRLDRKSPAIRLRV